MRIKIVENGPYLVSGGIPLSVQIIGTDPDGVACEWRPGKKYAVQQNYALCRCGRSSTLPFCDGEHTRIKFNGTETASRKPYLEQARAINGPTLKLTDARPLCAAARFCDRDKGIWTLTRRSKDPEARKIAVEEAANCPAGRLVVADKEGRAIEPEFEPSIVLVEDPWARASGPIWVRGGIPIESSDGYVYEIRNRVTLCRCGESSNKPFCDGSHIRVHFTDGDEALKK